MLSQKEKGQIRAVLAEELRRLSKKSENALSYSMNHERNIGRDSIDESMEEEIFSTEMRLHDREKFLLGKVTTLCIDCKEQSEREEQATEQAGRAGGFSELGEGSESEAKLPAEE